MSWVYVVSKSPVPTGVFTRYEKMIVWLELHDLELLTEWKVYRFADDQLHELGQQHFVELGPARFVLESDRDTRGCLKGRALGQESEIPLVVGEDETTLDELIEDRKKAGNPLTADEVAGLTEMPIGVPHELDGQRVESHYSSPLSSYIVTTRDGLEFPCPLRAGLMAGDTVETNFGTVTVVSTLLTDAGWAA